MDGSTMPEGAAPLDAPPPPKPTTVGDKAKKLAQPWTWEVKPKGPKVEKPLKWWAVWRWKFWNRPPADVKRSPIPGLGNLIKVDRGSLDLMVRWAGRLATLAVIANLVICAMYAFIVATQSELPLTRGWADFTIPVGWGTRFHLGDVARWTVVGVLAVMALLSAVVMQLGSDFTIPFSAGLAGDKHRVIPTVGIIAFLVCITLTASIKIDVFTGWGREREAQAIEKTTASEADQRILAKYPTPPPALQESDAKIVAANAQIEALTQARTEQADLRDKEEKGEGAGAKAGRGPKWQGAVDEIAKADVALAEQRVLLAAATATRAARVEYDDANSNNQATVRDVTEAARKLVYDSDFIVWIRSLGMSGISPFLVLVFFALRGARAEAARQEEINRKRQTTRQQNSTTFEGEFTEGTPSGTRVIDHNPDVEDGAVGLADTPTRRPPPGPAHPDAAGDDYGARNNGHEQGSGDAELPGKPADQ